MGLKELVATPRFQAYGGSDEAFQPLATIRFPDPNQSLNSFGMAQKEEEMSWSIFR